MGAATYRRRRVRQVDETMPPAKCQMLPRLRARRRSHSGRLDPERDRSGRVSECLPRLLCSAALCRKGLHDGSYAPGAPTCVYDDAIASGRGERPAGERRLDRRRQALRLPARGFLAALLTGRRPLARSPALGDDYRRLAAPSPAAARAFSISCAPITT